MFSSFVYSQAQKRGYFDDIINNSIRYGQVFVNDDNVMQSSQVYELVQDISNQVAMADWVVVDDHGNELTDNRYLKVLEHPNDYLTHSEFMKLMTNILLLHGEVYPASDGSQIHLIANVYPEIDDNLRETFKVGGEELPSSMIRHVKNVGLSSAQGVGLLDLGKNTLKGVMSAEKVLTDKYAKGGLMAFLLKLDANINPANGNQSKLIKAILDQLEAIDTANTVKLIPLGKGYDIDAMESPIDDDKTLAYLNVYKKDLGKYLGVDIDTYQSLMKADIEKAMMYLHNKAVRPLLQLFEEHLTALFFGSDHRFRLKAKINILDFVPYSTKTNIAYNMVRTMITTPDDSREMLGFQRLNTAESSKLYISKDLIAGEDLSNATQDSLKGGDSENGESSKNV